MEKGKVNIDFSQYIGITQTLQDKRIKLMREVTHIGMFVNDHTK